MRKRERVRKKRKKKRRERERKRNRKGRLYYCNYADLTLFDQVNVLLMIAANKSI